MEILVYQSDLNGWAYELIHFEKGGNEKDKLTTSNLSNPEWFQFHGIFICVLRDEYFVEFGRTYF